MFAINKITRSRTSQFLGLGLLLIALLPQLLWPQTNWLLFYQEDFEDGVAEGWNLGSDWSIENDDGNNVLSGEGVCWSQYIEGRHWKNYSYEVKIKLIQDTANLYFRDNPERRYIIGIGTNSLILAKEMNDGLPPHSLQNASISFNYQTWHTIKIQGFNDNIKIYADNLLTIDYTDTDPVLNGTIGLETFSHSHFDDLIVRGESPLPPGVSWQKTSGPYGGLGYDVRIDHTNPDIIYVTDTFAGVLKSNDGGKNWREINNGITVRTGASGDQIPIFCLTIDPSNHDILWAGTLRIKGVFKSTDGGENWEIKTEGITTEGFSENAALTFRDFAVDPNNSDIVFVSGEIEDTFDGETKSVGVIYKSADGGNHWRKVLEADNLFRPIDIDPNNPNVIYAATGIFDRASPGLEGAFKSTDGGETWFKINNGINKLVLGFLDRDPSNSMTLFAVSGREPRWGEVKGTIYKTLDGGNNWTEVFSRDWPMTTVVVSPSDSNTVYAGGEGVTWRSNDGGNNWQNLGFNCPGYLMGIPIGMAVDHFDHDIVYMNSYDGGVFKSIDGGNSWVPACKGIVCAYVNDLVIDCQNPNIIYTVAQTGTFKSDDGGERWIGINYGPLSEIALQKSISVDPTNPEIVYCGNQCSGILYKSIDGGYNWNMIVDFVPIDPAYQVRVIEISKSHPEIIYVGIINADLVNDIYADGQNFDDYGIFKSSNNGISWSEANTGISDGYRQIFDIAVHPSNPDIVYAAVRNSGIYKTTNGGDIWLEKNNGLTSLYICTITIDPNHPDTIYAGTINGSGVFKSTNGGETWSSTSDGMTLVCPSNLLPIGRSLQGISLEKPKFFNSTASYPEWPWSTVTDIIVDPSNSQVVYTGDLKFGVYRSTDGGANWVQINEGLSMRAVSSLAISDDGHVLYAGTHGGGVFRLVLGGNQAPQILSTIPNASDTVSISQGDSLIFEVMACDLNGDTLSYAWSLDSQFLEGEIGSRYMLKTIGLVSGDHLLNVEVADRDTSVSVSWDIKFITPTAIDNKELPNIPNSFALHQNYPNPFNPETTIKYELPKSAQVVVKIHNLLGQEINTLVNEHKKAGYFTINWDGKNSNGHCVSSGIYLYRIDAVSEKQHFIQTKKMILLQ